MPDSCAEKNSSAFRTSLQIGFGIGDGLKMLAKEFPTAQLIGLDLSEAMVKEAQATLVPEFGGRLTVSQADVCVGLGLAPDSCALIYNMNCAYFWPDLDAASQAIRAPLRLGGSCVTVMKPADVVSACAAACRPRTPPHQGTRAGKHGHGPLQEPQPCDRGRRICSRRLRRAVLEPGRGRGCDAADGASQRRRRRSEGRIRGPAVQACCRHCAGDQGGVKGVLGHTALREGGLPAQQCWQARRVTDGRPHYLQ